MEQSIDRTSGASSVAPREESAAFMTQIEGTCIYSWAGRRCTLRVQGFIGVVAWQRHLCALDENAPAGYDQHANVYGRGRPSN